jgi:hypothetical protein
MGRFMSPDTDFNLRRIIANPQKWNRYAYVLNNPLIMIDPDGLAEIYVFRPEARSLNASWRKAARDAEANGNHMHFFNGAKAGIRGHDTYSR